jgi:type IV pilus assembly protein PilW
MSRCIACPAHRAESGLSLVELLVAMAIALVLTLAVANVMTHNEGSKRTTTSVNDANQTGAYVTYVLDRAIRSAGSGYAQRWAEVFGCRMNVSRDNTQVLPRLKPFPAPFQDVPAQLGVAPVLIAKGADETASDALIVMTGSGGIGETGQPVVAGTITADRFSMHNTLGWAKNDLLLVAQANVGCMLQQVHGSFAGPPETTLTLAGRYYSAAGATVGLATFAAGSDTTYAIKLGNADDNNPPLFQMFGVGANATLVSYDLLQIAADDATVPLAEGVVQIRALYGVDTDDDNRVDQWKDPGAGDYEIHTLLNGSAASLTNLKNIVAVRIGLILRSSLIESDRFADPSARRLGDDDRRFVAPKSVNLFEDLTGEGLKYTRELSDDERRQRHRAVEVTIPLRNMLTI